MIYQITCLLVGIGIIISLIGLFGWYLVRQLVKNPINEQI